MNNAIKTPVIIPDIIKNPISIPVYYYVENNMCVIDQEEMLRAFNNRIDDLERQLLAKESQ